MKKISKGTADLRIESTSRHDGIIFTVLKEFGPITAKISNFKSENDDGGEKSHFDSSVYEEELINSSPKVEHVGIFKFFMLVLVALMYIGTIVFIKIPNVVRVLTFLWVFIFGMYNSAEECLFFFGKIMNNEKIKSTLRFTSAGNAALNAYYDLGRVPTLEEIKNYSNYTYNCTSIERLNTTAILWIAAILVLLFYSYPIYIVLVISIIIVLSKLSEKGIFFFMEFLITSKPTEKEYTIAIEGLSNIIKQVKLIGLHFSVENEDGSVSEYGDEFDEDEVGEYYQFNLNENDIKNLKDSK